MSNVPRDVVIGEIFARLPLRDIFRVMPYVSKRSAEVFLNREHTFWEKVFVCNHLKKRSSLDDFKTVCMQHFFKLDRREKRSLLHEDESHALEELRRSPLTQVGFVFNRHIARVKYDRKARRVLLARATDAFCEGRSFLSGVDVLEEAWRLFQLGVKLSTSAALCRFFYNCPNKSLQCPCERRGIQIVNWALCSCPASLLTMSLKISHLNFKGMMLMERDSLQALSVFQEIRDAEQTMQQRPYDPSDADLISALQILPMVYVNGGWTLALLWRIDEAISWLQCALEMDPSALHPHWDMFRIFFSIGQWDKCLEWGITMLEKQMSHRLKSYGFWDMLGFALLRLQGEDEEDDEDAPLTPTKCLARCGNAQLTAQSWETLLQLEEGRCTLQSICKLEGTLLEPVYFGDMLRYATHWTATAKKKKKTKKNSK